MLKFQRSKIPNSSAKIVETPLNSRKCKVRGQSCNGLQYKTSTGGVETVVFVEPYCAVTRTVCFFNLPVIRVQLPSNHCVSNLCSLPFFFFKCLESRTHEFQDQLYNLVQSKSMQTFSTETSESCYLYFLLHCIPFAPSIYPVFWSSLLSLLLH